MLVIILGAGDITVLNKDSNISALHCGACIVMKDSQAVGEIQYEWGLNSSWRYREMSTL